MRILKRIFELVFIFILPLVFCFCSFKKEIINTYDSNNNLLTIENNYTWDFPFNDFKDSNHYINKLDYNQTKYSNLMASLSNGLNTLNYTAYQTSVTSLIPNISVVSSHYYYVEFKINSDIVGQVGLRDVTNSNYLVSYVNNFNIIFTNTSQIDLNMWITSGVLYNGSFYFTLIDLTKMFGSGYEPSSFSNYESLIKYSDNTIESLELDYYSSLRVSYNYEMNYTFWGKLFNDVLIDTLKFNDVFVVRFASSYIVLVIFMVFAYHMLIWPLDLLFRIVFFKGRL